MCICATKKKHILQLHGELVIIVLTNSKYLELTNKIHMMGNNLCCVNEENILASTI